MAVLFLFAVASWSACFLVAEARLFGCDTAGYLDMPTETDAIDPYAWEHYGDWVAETGVFKIRQRLLRFKFFQELLGCYFCLGSFWVGVPLHFAFRYHFGAAYPLDHAWAPAPAAVAILFAMLASGAFAYSIEQVLERIRAE